MHRPRRRGKQDPSSPSDTGSAGGDPANDPLAGTIDVARDGVLVTDGDAMVRYVNPILLAQVRLEPSQILGVGLRSLLAPRIELFDPVTGLPREGILAERASPILALARRKGRTVAVARLAVDARDADPDETMRAVAGRLETVLRDTDLIARQSDGTFALVLQEVNPDESLGRAAGRILAKVQAAIAPEAGDARATVRMGMALFPRDASGWEELLGRAGAALSRAAETGVDFAFHEEGFTARTRERLLLEQEFADASDASQLLLHYQPVVATESGRIVGAEALARGNVMGIEALARWPHQVRGLVPPAEFIPIAEQTGRILSLDRWAAATAIAQASAWWDQGWTGWVSVNLSTRSIRDPELASFIGELLRSRNVPPARLVLEITESAAMRDPEATVANLHALKELGVQLALDDFGTGHSSLVYLKRLPVDYIKLDRSFLDNVATDERDRWLIESIVALAHRIGAQVVAEGVEKPEDLDWLRTSGCDLVQGFLTGRPAPADEMDPGRPDSS